MRLDSMINYLIMGKPHRSLTITGVYVHDVFDHVSVSLTGENGNGIYCENTETLEEGVRRVFEQDIEDTYS